jgi:hypothetical protein
VPEQGAHISTDNSCNILSSDARRGAARASKASYARSGGDVDDAAARESHKRARILRFFAEKSASAPQKAAPRPAAAAAPLPEAASMAQVAQCAAQGSVLALHLSTSALNQSAENRTMLMLLANEALYLRSICANLSTQNAFLAHAFAARLATNKRCESANAARVPTNAANMTNIALVRDAILTGADATRGIPVGQYPDHSPSDSETSDSESAPSERL